MIRVGSTITLEAWDNKFKPNQDWNHAWGACLPISFLVICSGCALGAGIRQGSGSPDARTAATGRSHGSHAAGRIDLNINNGLVRPLH